MTRRTLYPEAVQSGRVSVVGTRPATSVVSLEEAKIHLRVDTPDEDAYIQGLIDSAAAELDAPEGWLGRSLLSRTLRLTLDAYPPPVIRLPAPPIRQVTAVEYPDGQGGTVAVPADVYRVDTTAEPGLLYLADGQRWPSAMPQAGPDVLRIEYEAGYGDTPDTVPRPIHQWVLLRVGELYRDREASIIGTTAARLEHARRMLDNYRIRV